MSREDLSALLTELSDGVTPRPVAAEAWARARRIRRRRVAVGAAVAVVLVSASVTLGPQPVRTPAVVSGVTPSVTSTGGARIDRVPARVEPDPSLSAYWPAALDPPANAPTFEQAPLSHAVLLFQRNGEGPIYAYGEGSINGGSGNGAFGWVRLDVPLVDTRDGDGNRSTPLSPGSLGPLGNQAAFAQPDEYVVVDFRTASVHRIPLPGLNQDVTWFLDGRHMLVSSTAHTWLVSVTKVVAEVAASGFTVTPLVGDGTGLTTMALDSSGTPVVVRYDDEGRAEVGRQRADLVSSAPYRIDTLTPRGWRDGNLIAQAALGRVGERPDDFVIVVDKDSGTITNVLDLADSGVKGCCAVVGWRGHDSVVVRTGTDLLSWRLSTGEVTRVVANMSGMLSLAANGCPSKLTIEGMTTSCTT